MTTLALITARRAREVRQRLMNPPVRVKPPEPPPPPSEPEPEPAPSPIDLTTKVQRRPSVRAVLHAVSEYYNVGVGDLLSRSKRREIVRPRQVAMYLAHKYCGVSVAQLARMMGRDHTTVLHGKEKVERMIETGADSNIWRLSAEHLENRLNANRS